MSPINALDLNTLMGLALDEARAAVEEGNVGIGAVLVSPDGDVIRAHNTERFPRADRTRHAEMNLLDEAARREIGSGAPRDRLRGFVLVSTAEPCSGCASFAYKSGIRDVVFGAAAEPSMDPWLPLADLVARAKEPVEVVSGVRADECAAVVAASR